jgi:ADP-heptose:LPS heptosyltransferase
MIEHPYVFAYEGGLGDAYIQLPALRALHHLYGDKLTVITTEMYQRIYATESFSRVLTIITEPTRTHHKFDLQVLMDYLKDADLFIDLNCWYLPEEYDAFIRSRPYPTIGRFTFFNKYLQPDYSINSFDNSFNLIQLLDATLSLETFAAPPAPPQAVQDYLTRTRALLGDELLLFGIHDETKPEKMWRPERFEQLINRLLATYPNAGVLLLSRRTSICIDKIEEPDRVLQFTQPFQFEEIAGLVQLSDFFISIDSVFLHLADLCRIPAIGLFGPTSPEEWGLRFTQGHTIAAGSGKVEDISVDEVFDSIRKLSDTLAVQA